MSLFLCESKAIKAEVSCSRNVRSACNTHLKDIKYVSELHKSNQVLPKLFRYRHGRMELKYFCDIPRCICGIHP